MRVVLKRLPLPVAGLVATAVLTACGLAHLTAAAEDKRNPPGGPSDWGRDLTLCFAVHGNHHCGSAVYDTGTPAIQIVRPGAEETRLPPDTAIEVGTPDGTWHRRYVTGPNIQASIGPGSGDSIAGLSAYAGLDVRYDLAEGTVDSRAVDKEIPMPTYTDVPFPFPANALQRWISNRRTRSARPLSAAEIAGFRRAQALSFRCAQAAAAQLRPGWTEGRTQEWMATYLRDHGVKTWLHKPIAAFAERTLAPDNEWGPARGEGLTLGESDVAILDCSPIVDGYTGDIAYTVSVGPNPELERAQQFLSRLRSELPARFVDPERSRTVFEWVTEQMTAAGYQNAANGYIGHVFGHRVYRHGRLAARFPYFPPERLFGYELSWHSPGFLLNVASRLVLPEELGPLHTGPKTGIWAIEPHIRVGTFGAKFEELLVVDDDRAYWLDDISQRRIIVSPKGEQR